jgi:ABC-type polysaccharide/polyol phosphate transport system ATPase subunit
MIAIELRDVHKAFRIPHELHTTLTERMLSGFRRTTYEHFEALCGIDLRIEAGAFVGLIGGNGSGKSTLLKIMSGLLPPDRGAVHVDGSMSALLELGLGFSAELTVRENVELYAAVLGYPRREVVQRVNAAIAFADLTRFRDAKLKNLSTGMRARLGFATALQAESDILLLDEILAVGDAEFQLKCLHVFEELKRQRKTIVLVTHNLPQVQRFCDEAVWLNRGRIAARGEPDAVIGRYLDSVDAHGSAGALASPAAAAPADVEATEATRQGSQR